MDIPKNHLLRNLSYSGIRLYTNRKFENIIEKITNQDRRKPKGEIYLVSQ
jgi:hypothetical protein